MKGSISGTEDAGQRSPRHTLSTLRLRLAQRWLLALSGYFLSAALAMFPVVEGLAALVLGWADGYWSR